MMSPGYLVFDLREHDSTVELTYSYPPDYPLYREGRRNDVYRIGVNVDTHDAVTVVMQHLRLSEPPYSEAEAPGRIVGMTLDQFSRFVDALVTLRDTVKR